MGPLSQTAAERNVLTRRLVERDHEIIWRDVGSRDYAVVQCLQQSQSLLLGTAGNKRDLQQNQVIRIVEPQERPRVKELPRRQDVESPLLIVTLSRSTCAISGFSCLLGRLSTSVGFMRRMDMACMNMYLHTILMRGGG